MEISQPVTNPSTRSELISVSFTPGTTALLRYSTNAMELIQDVWDTAAGGLQLMVRFRQPYTLRPGVYEDTIQIDICTDSTCTRFVQGTTTTAIVRMTVTPVAGLSMTVPSTSFAYDALITDGQIPGLSAISVTFHDVAVAPTVRVVSTANTIQGAQAFPQGATQALLGLNFRAPMDIGVGDFTDTVTVTACLDPNCVNPLPQSPMTLQFRTRVTDTVGGTNGYRAEILGVHGVDMAWDAQHGQLYVASPDRTPDYTGQSWIVSIAADAARTRTQATLPWQPGPLALSTDHQYLFAGVILPGNTVQRLTLPSMTVSQTINLGSTADGPRHARVLRQAPGASGALAIARSYHPMGSVSAGVVVHDGTIARPDVVGEPPDELNGPIINNIAWGNDATHLFASSDSIELPELYELSVAPSGVQLLRRASAAARWGLHYWNGILYSGNGRIFDATTLSEIGRLVPPDNEGPGDVMRTLIDGPRNRIYALVWYPSRPWLFETSIRKSVVSFDLAQRTPIASASLNSLWNYRDIELFGNDGIALLSDGTGLAIEGKVTLLSGRFVQP